jgi:hypothetical protein
MSARSLLPAQELGWLQMWQGPATTKLATGVSSTARTALTRWSVGLRAGNGRPTGTDKLCVASGVMAGGVVAGGIGVRAGGTSRVCIASACDDSASMVDIGFACNDAEEFLRCH